METGTSEPKTSPYVPRREIQKRISTLQGLLRTAELEGMLVIQRVDLFYFSGTAQNGLLYIPPEGEPLLMIRKYLPRAQKESPLRQIVGLESIQDVPGLMQDFYGRLPGRLGFELDVIPAGEFAFYRRMFPHQACVDASSLILRLRAIKSHWELIQMERTAQRTWEVFQFIRENLAPGRTELESAGIFEAYARKLDLGARLRIRDYQTEGYPWHILSGTSGGTVGLLDSPASGEGPSVAFPCGAGHKALEAEEPIMVDFASNLDGYHMDETRMFSVGPMPQKALDGSNAAIEIHNEVLQRIRPGVRLSEIFDFTVARAESLGYGRQYLGPPGHQVRFVGHGIGLELIEPPIIAASSDQSLQAGMTFALEPKLVFENEFAAGVESVITVTEKGHRMISKIPVTIFHCQP